MLLSVVASLPVSAASSEYSRESEVRWSDADLRARPFGVRHQVNFFPDTTFEVVFDSRLNTSRDAVSYAGFALNDPGSMAVLTQFKGLIKLTVDSPSRGHFSVHPQPDGRMISRQYTGENAKYEPDDFGDPESHLAYTNQVLAKYDSGAMAATCGEPSASPDLAALKQEKARIEAEIAALLIGTAATTVAETNSNDSPPAQTKPPECVPTRAQPCDVRPAPATTPQPNRPKEEPSRFSFSFGGFGGFGGGNEGAQGRGGGVGFDVGSGIQMVVMAAQLASKKKELDAVNAKIAAASGGGGDSANYAACTAQLRSARANHERVQRWLQREIANPQRPRVGAATLPSAPAVSATVREKVGDALAELASPPFAQVAQVTSDATLQSPAAQSVRSTALPSINTDTFGIDSSCSDSAGRINLAVVVSQKVMAKAGRTSEERAILYNAIIHGLDITNASMRGSNISTPGIDAGFTLANVQSEPLALSIADDGNRNDAVNSVYGAYLTHDTSDDAKAFYKKVDANAPNADVVLLLIEGDATFSAPRGMAFGTRNATDNADGHRRLAVVKHKAAVAEYFYTFAHELGHILGAGHDELDKANPPTNFQSFARGAVVTEGSKRWASLMALSACPASNAKADETHTCRRVPYYSSAALNYPGYSATKLGDIQQDNASAMRLVRDNVARLRCSQARETSVWLQKGTSVDPALNAQAWEAESIWVLPEQDDKDWRRAYAHQATAAGADAFVNVMLHNASSNSAKSQLQVWRARPAKGLLLSPRWDDMERIDQTQCSRPITGNIDLAPAATTIVQMPCTGAVAISGTFAQDSWAVRWVDSANTNDERMAAVFDTVAQQPLAAWRSMRDVPLDLEAESVQTVLVRKRAKNESRQVNVRIETVPNQYNFMERDSGLVEVRFPRNVCRDQSKPECVSSVVSRTEAVSFFNGTSLTLELSLIPEEEVPITLRFKRTADVPQQSVLLRVFEEDVKPGNSADTFATRVVGGTSFSVRHAPREVKKAK